MNPYFPHEGNARNDEKLIAMRMKYGWEGYGIYWAIVEKLRDADSYRLSCEYELIAYDLRTDIGIIESIINDFGLFEITNNTFHSPALSAQMEWKDIRISQAREAASSRWKRNNSQNENKNPKRCFPPTIEEVKGYCKLRKNNINPTTFVEFYQSKGWMVGSNKMKDWKAAIRRWEVKNRNKPQIPDNANDDSTRIHPALQ